MKRRAHLYVDEGGKNKRTIIDKRLIMGLYKRSLANKAKLKSVSLPSHLPKSHQTSLGFENEEEKNSGVSSSFNEADSAISGSLRL